MIQVKDLSFRIGQHQILKRLSFKIESGSITTIFGPNGAGKTTLFKIICGILQNYSGSVKIEENSISRFSYKELSKKITFLPQFHLLTLPVRVEDILLAGRYPYSGIFNRYTDEDYRKVESAASELGISSLLQRDATTLSGGEIKKVMLASAFIQDVPLILLDEPFVSLDPQSAITLREMILKLNRLGKTIVIISHRMELLYHITTHLVAISNGELLYSGIKKADLSIFKETLGVNFSLRREGEKSYLLINE